MKKRPVDEMRNKLSELLDLMELAEKQGCPREQISVLGAFADGIAYALGENLEENYFDLAAKLAGVGKEETKSPGTWTMV